MSFLFSHSHGSGHAHSHDHGHAEPFADRKIFASHQSDASFVGEGVKAIVVAAPLGALYGASKAWWFRYPITQGFGLIGSSAIAFGAFSGIYMASSVFSANVRHKDDVLNATVAGFTTGFAYGMKAGSLQKMIAYSTGFAAVASWGKFLATEIKENQGLSRYEKEQHARKFFQGNERDPYKTRWEAIQAREAAAGDDE
ncbi:hypothetical protein BC830DRAFT_1125493 [Chytriomyces sp. MP71]|nr:hypothetical protein BC830DRAFT_1125493 [Chytriomyces sp. MP71]